jgi:hypothetical protein
MAIEKRFGVVVPILSSLGSFPSRTLTSEIYLMEADGSNLRRYDIFPEHSDAAAWWANQ